LATLYAIDGTSQLRHVEIVSVYIQYWAIGSSGSIRDGCPTVIEVGDHAFESWIIHKSVQRVSTFKAVNREVRVWQITTGYAIARCRRYVGIGSHDFWKVFVIVPDSCHFSQSGCSAGL